MTFDREEALFRTAAFDRGNQSQSAAGTPPLLIEKTSARLVPRRTEYQLTEKDLKLRDVIAAMARFGETALDYRSVTRLGGIVCRRGRNPTLSRERAFRSS
jgi:hypothetical protein